jgi:hypothetical protein
MPLKEVEAMAYDGGNRLADALPSLDVPDLDLDPLKEEIRQEVSVLRSSGRRLFPDDANEPNPEAVTRRRVFDARAVRSMIALANSFADVGIQLPPARRFKGGVRRLARLAARLILALSRFITDRQRNFNHLTTRSLNNLADGLERTTAELAEQVHTLQELSKRQAEHIASLEAALRSQTEPARRKHSRNRPAQRET